MSFYEPLGDGRFRATAHTSGPWDPRFQHAGPPAALLGRALERCEPRDGFILARLTYEILRPIPVDDVAVIAAIERFRAGGYVESLGFTVYDTLRYRDALRPLVEKEVQLLVERLGDVDPDRAVEIVRAGRDPLRDLLGAMHSKMLLEELRRVISARAR